MLPDKVKDFPQSFSLTHNGKTQTFQLGPDYHDMIAGTGHLDWQGDGLKKLIELGLWKREVVGGGKLKTEPPTIAATLALAAGNKPAVSAPAVTETVPIAQRPLPAPTATTAAVLTPQVATVLAAPPLPLAVADAPEVVAARVNGQRTSAHAEEIRAKFGWDEIVSQINAEARPSRGRQ